MGEHSGNCASGEIAQGASGSIDSTSWLDTQNSPGGIDITNWFSDPNGGEFRLSFDPRVVEVFRKIVQT